jgi:RNA polymerase sigma-70 factor, ECF subfamily
MSLEDIVRTERGPVLATLIRYLGDITAAEDAVQEAALAAIQTWPRTGTPSNPAAWLTTTAKHKALDRIRRESSRADKEREAALLATDDTPLPSGIIRDDQLRLIFTVCHPALALENQIALALRTLAGLTTPEIAHAFLVSETTMGQRISRAKSKIISARIPYRIPEDHELPDRLAAVLHVVSSIFTTGHQAPTAQHFNERVQLCDEAIRLSTLLLHLMPDEPECIGLHALLLATHARRAARSVDNTTTPDQVLLANQDRSLWDRAAIAQAASLIENALKRNRIGPYQLQAAIACVHGEAPTFEDTDWDDIARLYRVLYAQTPTAVVLVNRAVAEAFAYGPSSGLQLLDTIPAKDVANWFRFWATKAELLTMAGNLTEALSCCSTALTLPMNDTDRTAIQRRMAEVDTNTNKNN